ncbi:hypothetical protein AWENTII_004289 [Aspergillus wentii]
MGNEDNRFHIKFLFEDFERNTTTSDWANQLLNHIKEYESCFIKSITHVKNLNCPVLHEYLQVEVLYLPIKQKRTRLIAERVKDKDQVISGNRNWTSGDEPSPMFFSTSGQAGSWASEELHSGSSSSSSGHNGSNVSKSKRPLPLYTLKFERKRFPIVGLALVLRTVSEVLGGYHFLYRNCYVFARVAYECCKELYGGTQKKRKFGSWRGANLALLSPKTDADVYAKQFEKYMKKIDDRSQDVQKCREENTPPIPIAISDDKVSINITYSTWTD